MYTMKRSYSEQSDSAEVNSVDLLKLNVDKNLVGRLFIASLN